MKNKLFKILPLLASIGSSHAAVILLENFEDAVVDYTISGTATDSTLITAENTTELADNNYYGIVDYSGINSAPNIELNNQQGGSYFGVADSDGLDGTSADVDVITILWANLDISGVTDIEFSGFFAEDDATDLFEDWDANTSLIVQYNLDNTGFTNLLAIESSTTTTNSAPRVDTNFDGIGDGDEITNTLTQYSALINGTGTNLDLRIIISNLDATDDDIAFDNILIEGTAIPEPSSTILVGLGGLALLARRKR